LVTGAIVGGRNAKQVEQIMAVSDLRLTEREISEIEGVAEMAMSVGK
jgi:aryl-alcohol dehydrogenase-like predicted oxidoreductase